MGAAEDLLGTWGPVVLVGAGGLDGDEQAPADPSLSVGQIEQDRRVPGAYQTLETSSPSSRPLAGCVFSTQPLHPTPT